MTGNGHAGETRQFRVSRTSHRGEGAPIPEAYAGTFTAHAYCTLPLAKAMKADQTGWFRGLTNHRSAPGGGSVADRPDTPCWFVDIASLADVEARAAEHAGAQGPTTATVKHAD